MNGIKYLLDTCFIIEPYNGHQGVTKITEQNNIHFNVCAISPINRMEVLGFANLSDANTKNLENLLDILALLNQNTYLKLPFHLANSKLSVFSVIFWHLE